MTRDTTRVIMIHTALSINKGTTHAASAGAAFLSAATLSSLNATLIRIDVRSRSIGSPRPSPDLAYPFDSTACNTSPRNSTKSPTLG